MKILITGKNGRLGNAFIEYISRSYPDEMDIDTVSLRDSAWSEQDWSAYDAVLHLAGITKSDTGKILDAEKQTYYSINRDLSVAVAGKAKRDGVSYFIFASTMMVYGNSAPIGEHFTIDRNTVPNPPSAYGKSKLAGEKGIMELADDSFAVAIVREPVVYGEHIKGEFHKLWQLSGILPLFPVIDNTKSYIYEDNLCECFRQLLIRRLSGVFCPQNADNPPVCELFAIMRAVRGKTCIRVRHIQPVLKLLSHITRYVNAVFNDMKYTQELSVIEGIDYQVCPLKESIERCRK